MYLQIGAGWVGQRASYQVIFAGLGSRAAQSGPALVLAEAGVVMPPEQAY